MRPLLCLITVQRKSIKVKGLLNGYIIYFQLLLPKDDVLNHRRDQF
jgi:hypothetical protein